LSKQTLVDVCGLGFARLRDSIGYTDSLSLDTSSWEAEPVWDLIQKLNKLMPGDKPPQINSKDEFMTAWKSRPEQIEKKIREATERARNEAFLEVRTINRQRMGRVIDSLERVYPGMKRHEVDNIVRLAIEDLKRLSED